MFLYCIFKTRKNTQAINPLRYQVIDCNDEILKINFYPEKSTAHKKDKLRLLFPTYLLTNYLSIARFFVCNVRMVFKVFLE